MSRANSVLEMFDFLWIEVILDRNIVRFGSAERQATAAAAAALAAVHESEQEDAAPTPVVPDAAFSNRSADTDLNDRIEEIENDMQETFAEFQNIGTKNMDVMDEE
jgi:hypothetical protein